MRLRTLVTCLSAAAVVGAFAARDAKAEYPAVAPYIGIYGGATIPLRDWDLGENVSANYGNNPKTSGMLGGRLGLQLARPFAIEGELAWLPLRADRGDSNTAITYNLNLLVHFLSSDWTPYLIGGVGAYQNLSGGLGKDWDSRIHLGLGVRGLTNDWLALRLEVRDVTTDGKDDWRGNNLEATIGLDMFLSTAEKPIPDRDLDGVPDQTDACPDQAGPAATKGCPDADGDGIADTDDKCPKEPGTAALGGCPDSDNDGITDSEDECPKEAGTVEAKGCPDGDKDGVADNKDKCPKEPGPAAQGGCPDRDSDGVIDSEDACPDQAGPIDLKGCPDRDKDGVIDSEDQCPDTPGLKENKGCIPEAIKKFTGAIKGINFATGSAKLLANSSKVLDATVKIMQEYPSLRLGIEGHTDNVGKADANQKLSQDRAESVKEYLLSKGVAADRLKSAGFGDTKPVQDNKKAAGRAANRRIEFVPLGHE